jgi:beta-glucosidase-like glycosyl hydrolase
MGVKEQLIFPEIDYDSIDEVRGLDITITTSAQTDEEAFELLLGLGMPFAKEGRPGKPDADIEAQEAAEEEKRKEEARQRAEAEQAALEQLKEENPEAYEKPEPDEPTPAGPVAEEDSSSSQAAGEEPTSPPPAGEAAPDDSDKEGS